jgi:MFS family permease
MSPLRDRRFVLLLAGQAVNGIGSWCALVALWGYAAYKYDAGPAQIALLSLSWSLLGALLGPWGGVPVDRFGPRRTLIAADAFAVTVSVALAFSTSYWQLVALGACIGATRSVSEPAFAALAPRLVDDSQLLRANALLGAALMSSIAFGPLLAAGAIAAWGPRGAFLIDGATYLVGIAVVVPLRLSRVERAVSHSRRSALQDLREGLQIVRERIDVRYILGLAGSVYLVWGAYAVIEPIYVRDVLHRPASTFALLQAAFGVMLLLNALLVARLGERVVHMRTLRAAAIGSAVAAPIYVGTNSVVAAFIGIAIWGAATAHGRVLALDSTLRSLGHVIALPTAAVFIEFFGVRATAFGFALMPLLGVLATRRAVDPNQSDVGPRAEETPRVDAGFVAVAPAD